MWMKQKEVPFLAIQETQIRTNSRETRKDYHWYFAGEGATQAQHFSTGVGFVISKQHCKYEKM
eukprot:17041-Pyramimonas_sp.AAC.1